MTSLFPEITATSITAPRAMSLLEKYQPKDINDFIGLQKPKRALSAFARHPSGRVWFFVGRSGIGKTAMARTLATAITAELHILPADQCTQEKLARVWSICQKVPRLGCQRHMILVDQADLLSKRQQFDLRSKLEGESLSSGIVWVFTGTAIENLDSGFLSRCSILNFSSQGVSKEASSLLEHIWKTEGLDAAAAAPNFAAIVKKARNNIRASILELESKAI